MKEVLIDFSNCIDIASSTIFGFLTIPIMFYFGLSFSFLKNLERVQEVYQKSNSSYQMTKLLGRKKSFLQDVYALFAIIITSICAYLNSRSNLTLVMLLDISAFLYGVKLVNEHSEVIKLRGMSAIKTILHYTDSKFPPTESLDMVYKSYSIYEDICNKAHLPALPLPFEESLYFYKEPYMCTGALNITDIKLEQTPTGKFTKEYQEVVDNLVNYFNEDYVGCPGSAAQYTLSFKDNVGVNYTEVKDIPILVYSRISELLVMVYTFDMNSKYNEEILEFLRLQYQDRDSIKVTIISSTSINTYKLKRK